MFSLLEMNCLDMIIREKKHLSNGSRDENRSANFLEPAKDFQSW